jgi:geranylgeranyl pyrophosphate synthase
MISLEHQDISTGTGSTALAASSHLAEALCVETELDRLRGIITQWIDSCNKEMRPFLRLQFLGRSKYFRPAMIFACRMATSPDGVDSRLIVSAAALEMLHNMTLIVDDLLDRSRFRRGQLTLHCRYGRLPALMTAGFITGAAFQLVRQSPYDILCLSELIERLGAAECLQWRLRRHPLGIEDWRIIASEDTGTMFETCACLATQDDRLREFGRLVGMLYHGCDDVGDISGAAALGGGGHEDLRDGILTLPLAIAMRDADVAGRFRSGTRDDLMVIAPKIKLALSDAERYLDSLAQEAIEEANRVAPNPKPLISIVQHTRRLSKL